MLAERGAKVVRLDKVDHIADVAASLPGEGHVGFPADLLVFEALTEVVDRIEREVGPIEILVNNAGTALIDNAEDVLIDRWDFQMDLNLKTHFVLAQAVGRKIVNMAHKLASSRCRGMLPTPPRRQRS